MANLVELFDNIVQMQNLNGVPLANGKMYVYALGRTRLMDTWSDVDGESLNSNPIILDAAGQCHCYVSDDFDYTLVVTDAYDNEIFSIDKYLYSQGSHSHADVAVAPSETIAVSSYHVGETTVYVPYLTGQLGKVYEGIDPIVVNNTEDKISANHVPLGVQDPLYFVQDDEEGCIIGFSGQTIPEGVMSESGLGFENDKITGYNGSAFSAGNEYEAGSYVDITDNTISVTGLQPEGDYAYNSALSSKLDVTALPQDLVHSGDLTAYQPAGDYQTAGDYLSASDSANFLQTGDSANFLLTSDSGNFYPMEGNPSGFLTEHQSLDDYATKEWVEDKGYITGIDIQESANWNEATTVVNNNSAIWNSTTETVSSNSAAWGSATPQIPVTGINGIKISESGDQVVFEVSADYATHNDVDSAISSKAEISATIPVVDSFRSIVSGTDYIGVVADTAGNFYQIVTRSGDPQSAWVVEYTKDAIVKEVFCGNIRSNWPTGGWSINPYAIEIPTVLTANPYGLSLSGITIIPSSTLYVNGVVTANTAGITANSSLTADNLGITAGGLTAGNGGLFGIKCAPEAFYGGSMTGFTFSSQNTGFGSALLTTAYGNQIVQMPSPKFEARNSAGAGFSIEASGAKGYDHNGNVTWDTTVVPAPDRLISFAATQPAILISPTPSSYFSNAPYLTANYQELAIKFNNGPSATMNLNGFSIKNGNNQASIAAEGVSVTGTNVSLYVPETSASYSLINSIQQSMIEGDTATSAITAIAGSALSITYTTGTI